MLKLAHYASIAALTTLGFAAPATAQDEARIEIKIKDLNLSTAKDRARLDQRVRSAARSICGNAGNISTQAQQSQRNCIQQIIEGTLPQVRYAVAKANSLRDQVADAPIHVGTKG